MTSDEYGIILHPDTFTTFLEEYMSVKTRWYLEAVDSNAEKVLNGYPEFQKHMLDEDILHNIKDHKEERHDEVYRCDYDFVVQFRMYVNVVSKENVDEYQFVDLFRVFVRYGRDPIKDATKLFKVRRWKKKLLVHKKK